MIMVMRWRLKDRALVMSTGLYLAKSAGELKLQSPDPHVQPAMDYNHLADPFDRKRMADGVRLSLRIAEERSFADVLAERVTPTDDTLASEAFMDEWMLRTCGTMHHVSGTAKMGPGSDPLAVVDDHARVHGVESLRVVDCSIMPDCVRANTNATAIMMGERVADLIKSSG
jgi:choline dehydrogenase-like flavoprotein